MELLFIAIIGLAVAAYLSNRGSKARAQAELDSQTDGVRRLAEEDVTRLGEQVAELDLVTAGRALDEGLRQDYQRALDDYEAAKEALDAVRRPEDVRAVTTAVEDGRYAVACVTARVEGRPLPQRRPPCFFNPQHGPSVEEVDWAPAGGLPRPVPTCAADAERVRAGAEPYARKVLSGGERRPYWEAGPAYAPWAAGWFGAYAASGLLPGILLGSMLGGGFGSWDGGYDAGYAEGLEAGDAGGDSGGDVGGDAGGGDFGGDFGGGDFGGF